jgi:hypothetical protein
LPFRDYFDPGYVLTEISSAALQLWLGDNLLGEWLLNSVSIATGAALVLVLAYRVAGSYGIAFGAAALALLSLPRAYDFDKFLFYPLGIFLCWKYVDRTTLANLIAIAVAAVIAGMFRYDNGILIVLSAAVTLSVVHWSNRTALVRRLGAFAAACLIAGAPYVVFLQMNGGLANAIDQVVTYAQREGGRTRLRQLPMPALSQFRYQELPTPPANRVYVRWSDTADEPLRAELEARYTLTGPTQQGNPENHTWSYLIEDVSRENLRALVTDARVVDTHLVDRSTFTLVSEEPAWIRLRRSVPLVNMVAYSWPAEEAADILYWLFVWVPIAAAAIVLRRHAATPEALVERARVLSLAVMCLMITALILRNPLMARIAGASPPIAVLSAWAVHRVRRMKTAVAIVLILIVGNLAVMADWSWMVRRTPRDLGRLPETVRAMAASPPDLSLLPPTGIEGLTTYLRECTRPEDRVYASWFVPELYFFAQRAFAGGMVVTFGHWVEPEYQRRIIATMASEQVPIVVHRTWELPDFRSTYRLLDEYLQNEYREAGKTSFSDRSDIPADAYTLLVHRGRTPTGVHTPSSMPCFR